MDLVNNKNLEFYDQAFNNVTHTHISVQGKIFDGCQFNTCDFTESTLAECSFTDCTFTHCNLNLLKVPNSKFSNVEFLNCKMRGIDWTKAYWRDLSLDHPFSFKECLISASTFHDLDIPHIQIIESKARDVDFRDANLKGTNFSETDLSNSLFNNTNLTEANFYGATNYTIDITTNTVKDASFCRYEAVSLLSSLGIRLLD
ncbi:MAG: pentapeptide repeat-containing protein [Agarilytica sp.]